MCTTYNPEVCKNLCWNFPYYIVKADGEEWREQAIADLLTIVHNYHNYSEDLTISAVWDNEQEKPEVIYRSIAGELR